MTVERKIGPAVRIIWETTLTENVAASVSTFFSEISVMDPPDNFEAELNPPPPSLQASSVFYILYIILYGGETNDDMMMTHLSIEYVPGYSD